MFMHCYAYTCNHVQGALLRPSRRVGIAFSGGLDTSVAAVECREGAVPCTTPPDIGQYDEPDIASVPGALPRTARSRAAGRLPAPPWSRRARALACGPSTSVRR